MADEKEEKPIEEQVHANFPQVCFKCSRLIHSAADAVGLATKNGLSVAHKECVGK